MTKTFKPVGLIAAVAALIGATACGANGGAMDDALKNDLAAVAGNGVELVPRAQSQMVISPIEAGAEAAPASVSRKPTPKTPARVETRVAQAPEPRTIVVAPIVQQPEQHAPSLPAPSAEPAPLPPMNRAPAQRQSGTYKTEAEVFRQMPWIKP